MSKLLENCKTILGQEYVLVGFFNNLCTDIPTEPMVKSYSDTAGRSCLTSRHSHAFYSAKLLTFCQVVLDNPDVFKDYHVLHQHMVISKTVEQKYGFEDYVKLLDEPLYENGVKYDLFAIGKYFIVLQDMKGVLKTVDFEHVNLTYKGQPLVKKSTVIVWQG